MQIETGYYVSLPEIETVIYLHDVVGLDWPAISKVMKEYHGYDRSRHAWRDVASRNGCLPGKSRGVPIHLRSKKLATGLLEGAT